MRNDNLPLVQALRARAKNKPEAEGPVQSLEIPRTFELQHTDIPGLPGRRVGEAITVNLNGHIHSQHDGRTIIRVASVKPDSKEMEAQANPEAQAKEIRVRTQQSHA